MRWMMNRYVKWTECRVYGCDYYIIIVVAGLWLLWSSPCNRPLRHLDGDGSSAPRPGRFTPVKVSVPNVQEAGWAPGPVWTGAENLAPPGFDLRTVQPVASRYAVWAIPGRYGCCTSTYIIENYHHHHHHKYLFLTILSEFLRCSIINKFCAFFNVRWGNNFSTPRPNASVRMCWFLKSGFPIWRSL